MTFYLDPDKLVPIEEALELVRDGDTVALGGGLSARLPMALVRGLIRRGTSGLRVVGSAHSIDVDLLIAAGMISVCEESYVGFEQDLGLAPAYRRGAQKDEFRIAESCCVTMLTQLRAAEAGVPFMPVRGVKGSDIRRLHPEYAEVTCPFTGESLVVVPALSPDVALIHASVGDRRGNLHFDKPYVLDEHFAAASKIVVASAERIVSTREVVEAGITVPAHLVTAISEAPFGAHPTSCYPEYAYDRPHLGEYVAAAGTEEGVRHYLDTYIHGTPDEESYRKIIGEPTLERLRRWDASTDAWKELFA